MQVTEKIAAFRARMKDENFAAVIVPTADSHASEYIADYFKTRQWLSGFTGSAGTLVVGEKEAALFVDGRYFIQAERQIAGSGITLMRMGTAGTPKLEEYLTALLHENDALGVDFGVVSEKFAENMRETAAKCGALLRDTGDWFGDLWKDRPPMPQEKAFILDEQYAGQSVQSKVSAIRKVMAERGAQLHVLNVLDDIAWVLNVRGGDVLNTPVVMSYLVIGQKHVNWFVDETKVDDAMRKTLADEGVNVRGYDEIIPALKGLEPDVKVLADASKLTAALMNALEKAEIIRAENPSTMMKAVKNDVELENLRRAHVKDGVAVTRLMYWLKQNVGKIPMTEISVSDKLLALRREQAHFISPSFNTICAYRANAAMMHYSATPESDAKLEPRDLLLIDSGGSMDYHSQLCSQLFQAASRSNRFKELRVYYFHNCPKAYLYTNPTLEKKYQVSMETVLRNCDKDFKVLLLGDATMDIDDLIQPPYFETKDNKGYTGVDWLHYILQRYSHTAWLNPRPTTRPVIFGKESYALLCEMFDMYPLTIAGLELALKKLMVRE